MKIKKILTLLMLCSAFISCMSFHALRAQNAATGIDQKNAVLIGSNSKLEDAALKANAIFIGEILQIGSIEDSAKGDEVHSGSLVKVSEILKGSVASQISVDFKVRYYANERTPKTGASYIFFVRKNAQGAFDQFTVLKLLPATDDNIIKVKGVIAAAPASK